MNRKSPLSSATLYKEGTKKRGIDNNMWIVKKNVLGIKRWSKISEGKVYFTLDNGGRPFKVVIKDNNVDVYKLSLKDNNYDKLIKQFKVKKIHIGKHESKIYNGNTILLELLNNKLVFIGDSIYEFELAKDDVIKKYFSIVGNSEVPYPVLLGKNNFYSMIAKQYCSREEFPESFTSSDFKNGHTYFYGEFTNKGWKSHVKEKKRLPKLKMLYKRLW